VKVGVARAGKTVETPGPGYNSLFLP
jgi:hypothetical protein